MIPDQIVLATDFSPASSAALWVAGRFAKIFNAKVLVVHVFQYVAHHPYQIPVGWMIDCIRRDDERRINEARKVLSDNEVETEARLMEYGLPSAEILNLLLVFKHPLLVVGTHAIGGMDRFLIGSTAEEVLRQASCPVVTVGPHVSCDAGMDCGFRRLLYATDFSEASLAAAPVIGMLRKQRLSSLRVLHVSANPDLRGFSEDKNFDTVRKALDGSPERAGGDTEYVTLHGKDVSHAITNEAERYPADLVVLGVQRASAYAARLTPKIAFQVIAAAPCPVLTISS
jgi:nucleotide-binding universal stress UspA family protein